MDRKEDSSLYVRKNVANNLNDISKDNPNLVLETARRLTGENPGIDWIIRHGCRTLIRNANPEAMKLFGYVKDPILTTHASISTQPTVLTIGESCDFQYEVEIRQGEAVISVLNTDSTL